MIKMAVFRLVLNIFVYVVILCPISNVFCKARGVKENNFVKDHIHKPELPCDTCPRHGKCVPKVQCPAHVRPGGYNPLCHLGKEQIGICCFTGSGHAAEIDHKQRSSVPVSVPDTKNVHEKSKQKLEQWLQKAERLAKDSRTVVNKSSPSYGHHMSIVSQDARIEKLSRGGLLNLFAAQELKSRQAISDDELALGFTDHADGPYCPPPAQCPKPASKYRSIGGECNNAVNPSWGATNTGFERLLPPQYGDGVWGLRTSSLGLPLPSARTVSNVLLLDASHPSYTHNLLFMQFGQFIAHDISSLVMFTSGNGEAISCCSGDGEYFLPPDLQHWACAPVVADLSDSFYGQFRHQCLNFVRAQLAPSGDCGVSYAKQMNSATHFPDLSHLYGSTPEKFGALRAPGGLMKVFNDYGRELPPITEKDDCLTIKEGAACFDSGDSHGNQIISLTVFHTIWTREHNRIARALSRLNPDWNEDTIYMETRRIVQAEFQHVIYNEWLPLLLGPGLAQMFGLSPSPGYAMSYDPHTNPSLSAEFATSAMRFGHSIVDGKITLPNLPSGDVYETLSIPEVMFQPGRLRLRHFLDRILAGLSYQPMQSVDPFVTESLSRYLFHGGNPFGLDLASINIQRGRDFGVRSYNEYRKLIGVEPYVNFIQFPPNAAQRLSSVYESPEDIDLWIGGLLEEAVEGGVVGVTFAHIIADQFAKLKKGDRYFYENGPDVNPGAFTPIQLAEIKKVSLARIICDNRDGYELLAMAPSAFLKADLFGNEPVPCDSPMIPSIDLSRFKDI